MQNSQIVELKSPLAIVANDAGSANLIMGWLKDFPNLNTKFCVDGPAKEIFSKTFSNFENLTINQAVEDVSVILTGTSGASNLEHIAREIAWGKGILSIGVIDHWVNYLNRFIRNHKIILPNEIWVTDYYAYNIARKYFPKEIVKLKINRYLEQLIDCIRKKDDNLEKKTMNILYVLEPIRVKWNNSELDSEFQALNYFIENIDYISDLENIEIKLRPHPSENFAKYKNWLNKNKVYNIKFDDKNSLADLIAWSHWVVGCQTFPMVIALHSKKKVLCSLPPWAPSCKLPHKDIIKLKKLVK
jgi:hypothetical protein